MYLWYRPYGNVTRSFFFFFLWMFCLPSYSFHWYNDHKRQSAHLKPQFALLGKLRAQITFLLMIRTLNKLLHESSQIRRHRFFLCSNNLSSHCLWIISLIKWKNLQIIYFYLYFPIHEACRWFQIIWMLHVVWVTQLAQNFIFFFWSHVYRCTSVFHSTPISTMTIHMHSDW